MSVTSKATWVPELRRLFPAAAERLADELDEEAADILDELAEGGVTVPMELALFCRAIEDLSRVDLRGLGGPASVELCDLFGVLENNHPDQGTYGSTLVENGGPQGVILFGQGPHQLLYDSTNDLGGGVGAVWVTQDMSVTAQDAKRIAGSFSEFLAGARAVRFD